MLCIKALYEVRNSRAKKVEKNQNEGFLKYLGTYA